MLPEHCVDVRSKREVEAQRTHFFVDLNFNYYKQDKLAAQLLTHVKSETTTPTTPTEPSIVYYQRLIRVILSDKAVLYHYKDSPTVMAFRGGLSEQLIKAVRAQLLEPGAPHLPVDILNLVLSTVKFHLENELVHALNVSSLDYEDFQAKGIPKNSFIGYDYPQYGWVEGEIDTSRQLSELAMTLPGVNEIVKCPCEQHFGKIDSLFTVIIHLNDKCGWTREAIADWIESLDIDTEFKEFSERPNFSRPKNLSEHQINIMKQLKWDGEVM